LIGEIICVGTELLLGDILNTNARYLSQKLAELGVNVYFQTVVGDNEQRLIDVISLAKKRSDLIILTGGLGPTSDDITKETVSKSLGLKLYTDENIENKLKDFFKKRNLKMVESNLKQALIPEGATVLENNNGTAPGIIITSQNKHFVILPGPPGELIPMFEQSVIPFIREQSKESITSRTLKLVGIGESEAASKIQDLIDTQTNPTVAPYAKELEVHLRLTAKGDTKESIDLIDELENKIRERLGKFIYTTDEKSLEEVVVEKLINKNYTIATAESCTGGLLSSTLVNVSGVSTVFKEGVVTYSNEAKEKLLNVKAETLEKYGAVSEETAKEMANGIKNKSNSNIGIGITGIAGPEGGTVEKPVGLVYISIAIDDKTYVYKLNLSGNRMKIRRYSAKRALILLNNLV